MIKSVKVHCIQVDNLWSVSIGKKTYTVNGMGQQVVYLQIPWFFGVLLYLNKLSFFLLQNMYIVKYFFLFFFQCGDRKNRSINYHGDSDVSNRGQPAGLSSVNSTADERSASHAYTDRSKCLPLTIETPPVISLANNLRKVLFLIIWLT